MGTLASCRALELWKLQVYILSEHDSILHFVYLWLSETIYTEKGKYCVGSICMLLIHI